VSGSQPAPDDATPSPALPDLLTQQALAQRGGRFGGIETDEELRHVGRVIVARLADQLNHIGE
jgi:hypothetical protein